MQLTRGGSVVTASLLLAACGGGDGEQAATTAPPVASPPSSAAPGCRDVAQPGPRPAGGREPPTAILNTAKTYRLIFRTSCGAFTVELDPKGAPKTSASFLALARSGYFDGTFFHRVVPGFVIQGGDPTGTGSGGPGYATVDTPASDTTYTEGVVAMAKTATEPPGTAGSQFFVVTAADAGLPPEYAVVGRIVAGLAVVQRIGKLGDPSTELPTQPVVIEDVVVEVR